LAELMGTIPLTIVPNGVPADIRVDFTFSSGSGRIQAAIHGWAEKESIELQSERIRWSEDFQAKRRTIQPMPEAEAEAFRQQIVEELTRQVAARTAAVVIASEPDGLPLVTTVPADSAVPLNRNRTLAVLGCLRDGAELEGYVGWPDGHREQFKRRANQTPGRFVVGSPATTERPTVPQSPLLAGAGAMATEPSIPRTGPASSRRWYWWLGGPLVVILALLARTRVKNR
ncbi:MAG: hypothetical protein RL033_7492, partial [Pseudomonadota bacterium]